FAAALGVLARILSGLIADIMPIAVGLVMIVATAALSAMAEDTAPDEDHWQNYLRKLKALNQRIRKPGVFYTREYEDLIHQTVYAVIIEVLKDSMELSQAIAGDARLFTAGQARTEEVAGYVRRWAGQSDARRNAVRVFEEALNGAAGYFSRMAHDHNDQR